jgi:excisionase family DNA binding protein
MNGDDDRDELMTLDEVCAYLRMKKQTAYKKRSMGTFVPGYHVGKWLLFRKSAVDRWLEEHRDEE